MELRDQDLEPCCCASAASTPAPSAEQEQPRVTSEDRELARLALAERMKRKHPKRPPPKWFDRGDVEMVAVCAAAVDGARDAKAEALRDAISGAFCASKDAPTSRFIWEKIEHFLDHVERGRRRRLAAEWSAAPRVDARTPVHVPGGGVEPTEMAADLERLFGADWRAASQ